MTIKQAYEVGMTAALHRYGIKKEAFSLGNMGSAVGRFLGGQGSHMRDLGTGINGMMHSSGVPGVQEGVRALGRSQAMGAAKGLLPSMALGGGALLGAGMLGRATAPDQNDMPYINTARMKHDLGGMFG